MAMNSVRRIASGILGVGESRVRFRPADSKAISEALTREDVRGLIAGGSIVALPPHGVSRARGREKQEKMRKGRRMGAGSRKGTRSARLDSKTVWIAKVRAQRRYLRGLLEQKKMAPESSRRIYMMIKGNAFKGVKILETYLKDSKLIK
jgi:large subunit ribosomal protein L19e